MWSIRYKQVSVVTESVKTTCKVCRTENYKEIVTEKKLLTILYIIPVKIGNGRIEVCPLCHARVKVKESSFLIDSKV